MLCMTKREQLCLTRAIVLKSSGKICQLHVISDNNLSTLVTSCLLSLLRSACRSTAKQKTSSVWSYYSEECETPFVRCKKCSAKIKRGKDGDRKSWPSNQLWSHLNTNYCVIPHG